MFACTCARMRPVRTAMMMGADPRPADKIEAAQISKNLRSAVHIRGTWPSFGPLSRGGRGNVTGFLAFSCPLIECRLQILWQGRRRRRGTCRVSVDNALTSLKAHSAQLHAPLGFCTTGRWCSTMKCSRRSLSPSLAERSLTGGISLGVQDCGRPVIGPHKRDAATTMVIYEGPLFPCVCTKVRACSTADHQDRSG